MLIKEFSQYSKIDGIADSLRGIFPHVKVRGMSILASSLLDRAGNPLVRIDSKEPLIALMLKFPDGDLEIKSMVNSSGVSGLFGRVFSAISGHMEEGQTIYIDQDVSGGFWDHVVAKYPQYRWVKK